jgi:hypothetical protein
MQKTMHIIGTILITEQACYDVAMLKVDIDANRWVKLSVDLLEVIAIKEMIAAEEHLNLGETDKCSSLYMKNGSTFIVNENYEELTKVWIEINYSSNDNIILN